MAAVQQQVRGPANKDRPHHTWDQQSGHLEAQGHEGEAKAPYTVSQPSRECKACL